jgi:uncharacterized protein (DUF1778 family)
MSQLKRLPRDTTSIRFSEREKSLIVQASVLYGRTPAEFCRIAAVGEAILMVKQFENVPVSEDLTN